MEHWYLRRNAPKDVGWWDIIRDGGSFLAAVFAVIAAIIAFRAVQLQIAEARKEFVEQRSAANRSQASDKLLASLLAAAALELLRYDLDRMLNTFYPGPSAEPMSAERARFIRQRMNPLLLDSVLP